MKKLLAVCALLISQIALAGPPITWGTSGGNQAAQLFTNYLCFLDNTCVNSSTFIDSGSLFYLSSNTSVYGGTHSTLAFTGARNTVLGVAAGDNLTTGTDNTILGHNAETAAGSSNHVTAIGKDAIAANYGTAIGYGAQAQSLRGIAIGGNQPYSGGTDCIAIGPSAACNNAGSIMIGAGGSTNYDGNIIIGANDGTGLVPQTDTAQGQFIVGSVAYPITDVIFGSGAVADSAHSVSIRSNPAQGTNVTGGDLILKAGNGTGNAGSGSVKIVVASPGPSGSTSDNMQTSVDFKKDLSVQVNGQMSYGGSRDQYSMFSGASTAVSGSYTTTASGTTVTVTGTAIQTQWRVGDTITIGGESHVITAISVSGQTLTTAAWTNAFTSQPATKTETAHFYQYPNGTFQFGGTVLSTNNAHYNSTNNSYLIADAHSVADTSVPTAQFVIGGYTGGVSGSNPRLVFGKSRGTEATPSPVPSGETIGGIDWRGYDNNNLGTNSARFFASTTEDFGGTGHGMRFTFQVTPNGSSTAATALVIDQDKSTNLFGPAILNREFETVRNDNSTTSSPQNALSTQDIAFLKFTGSATITINCIDNVADGKRVVIANATGNNLTLAHNASGSCTGTAKAILNTGSASLTVANNGAIEVIYDSGSAVWRSIKP